MKIIETDRLLLQTVQEKDIEKIQKDLFSNKEVMQFAFLGKTFTLMETREFVENYFASEDSLLGLAPIYLKGSNELIGIGGITECNYFNRDDFEFGYIINTLHWGQGYANEIGKAQIDFAFNNLEVDRILALTNTKNERSIRVLENLGMNYIKDITTKNRGLRKVYSLEQ